MKKTISLLAAAALAFTSSVAIEAPAEARSLKEDREFCTFITNILDVPVGDCISALAGGRNPASFCRFIIAVGAIPEEEFANCVVAVVEAGQAN